jgi:hypothetical protein
MRPRRAPQWFSGANLLALAMRLTNTCVSRVASPCKVRPLGHRYFQRLVALTQQRLDQHARIVDDIVEIDALPPHVELPDSMRTLSSRLSMSRVSRSVPRSSDNTSSSSFSAGST